MEFTRIPPKYSLAHWDGTDRQAVLDVLPGWREVAVSGSTDFHVAGPLGIAGNFPLVNLQGYIGSWIGPQPDLAVDVAYLTSVPEAALLIVPDDGGAPRGYSPA